MSIAPFIRPIRMQGGTFYTFTSASEDLGFSFNSDDKKFRFSNYALLNIPDIRTPVNQENYIQFDSIPGAFDNQASSLNEYLAESFQNYALNLETMIISSPNYDPSEKRTVSERVFFKWLKEIGALRFREATSTETTSDYFGSHFVEEDKTDLNNYSKVVQYIGEIDVVNNVKNKDNAYTEVYIHIPTSHGAQPTILFSSEQDSNYYPNAEFTNNQVDPLNNPLIYGRKLEDTHPAGLSINAQFDSEFNSYIAGSSGTGNLYSYDDNTQTWNMAGEPDFYWWYPNPKENTYFLEKYEFHDIRNDKFKLDDGTAVVEYLRSRLDGICIQFNERTYYDIASNPSISSLGELAESSISTNFEFNAALVYYEIYDPNNPIDAVKNLFGVLFFDNVENISGGGGFIPRFEKVKPNVLAGDIGNAYSFKINLKFDVNTQDTAIETVINDYNTFSLDLYVDTLTELKAATAILQKNSLLLSTLENQFKELRGLVFDSTTADEIDKRIVSLENQITESQEVFANNDNILKLINRNYQEILNIYKNQTSINVAYNLDVLHPGEGIVLDKNSNQYVKISSNTQGFKLSPKPRISLVSDFVLLTDVYKYIHKLQPFSNWLRITDGYPGIPYNMDRDIVLYIDDTENKWQPGQKMRLSFSNGLNMNNTNGTFNLIIYSDAKDTLNTGFFYSAEVVTIASEEFVLKNNKPVIEIICIDPKTYDFEYDIF